MRVPLKIAEKLNSWTWGVYIPRYGRFLKTNNRRMTLMHIAVVVIIAMPLAVFFTNCDDMSNSSAGPISDSSGLYSNDYVALGTVVLKLNESGEVEWEKNLYQLGHKTLCSVVVASDGFIAVGQVVAKFNFDGELVWEKNLNPSGVMYGSVTAVSDGFVCVSSNFSDKGNIIFTKFSNEGELIWQRNFVSENAVYFNSIATVQGGVVAVGGSLISGPTMVKYDDNGNKIWEKNKLTFLFNSGSYSSIVAVPDGFVTVDGGSDSYSLGTNGEKIRKNAATLEKYDNDGNTIWIKTFDSSGADKLISVTAVPDGYIAVGAVFSSAFGNGAWSDNQGRGGETDALIVKFDINGNPIWWKNFGGASMDQFDSITAVPNGVIAVGGSYPESFGNGDWTGVDAKRHGGMLAEADIIAVNYDYSGNVIWAHNYNGPSYLYDLFIFMWVIILILVIIFILIVVAVLFRKGKLHT